jgi:hypothetical protein
LLELVKEINRLLEEKVARLKGMHKVNEHFQGKLSLP